MAKLTRKNIKVFAGNASNNGVFGSLQANNPTLSNDVETIQSLNAWGEGWNAATETSEELPPLEEIQAVEYVTTYQQAYLMQEGIPEWAASVTYYKGGIVKTISGTNFKLYASLADNNTGNDVSDTTKWKLVMDSSNLYALDADVVHIAGSETITGTKTFTANPVVKRTTPSMLYQTTNNIVKGTTPSTTQYYAIAFTDSNGVTIADRLGAVGCNYNTSGYVSTIINAYTPTLGSSSVSSISIAANNSEAHARIVVTSALTNDSLSKVSSSTDDDYIPTMGWVNNPATSTNVVHRSGDETVGGAKTFTANVTINKASNGYYYLKRNDVTQGTAPSSQTREGLIVQDSSSNTMGRFTHQYFTNKASQVSIEAIKSNALGDTDVATLSVTYPASGDPYASCPTPTTVTTSKTSTRIATTGWVNSIGNNVVHLDGTETITGNKTFSDRIDSTVTRYAMSIIQSDLAKGSNPSSDIIKNISFQGSDSPYLSSSAFARIHFGLSSAGTTQSSLLAFKNQASSSDYEYIGISYPTSGNPYTHAPASDVIGSIVTTTGISKSSNGYCKLGNGLIIQWGYTSASTTMNVTLPTPFTTDTYKVTANTIYNGGDLMALGISSKTENGFTIRAYGGAANHNANWIAIGY